MPSYAQTQSVQTTRTIQFEYWDVRKQHGMEDITKAAKKTDQNGRNDMERNLVNRTKAYTALNNEGK